MSASHLGIDRLNEIRRRAGLAYVSRAAASEAVKKSDDRPRMAGLEAEAREHAERMRKNREMRVEAEARLAKANADAREAETQALRKLAKDGVVVNLVERDETDPLDTLLEQLVESDEDDDLAKDRAERERERREVEREHHDAYMERLKAETEREKAAAERERTRR